MRMCQIHSKDSNSDKMQMWHRLQFRSDWIYNNETISNTSRLEHIDSSSLVLFYKNVKSNTPNAIIPIMLLLLACFTFCAKI